MRFLRVIQLIHRFIHQKQRKKKSHNCVFVEKIAGLQKFISFFAIFAAFLVEKLRIKKISSEKTAFLCAFRGLHKVIHGCGYKLYKRIFIHERNFYAYAKT